MKKQTSLYLSEYDRRCLEKMIKFYGLKSNGQVIRALIRSEADRLEKFNNTTTK